jgi:hypothetical protein
MKRTLGRVREIIKIPIDSLRKIHQNLNPDMGELKYKGDVKIQNANLTEPGLLYSQLLQQSLDDVNSSGNML